MPVTDYKTGCGNVALGFTQMLGSLIRGYHITAVLHYRLNILMAIDACTELDDFLTCDISHIDPERQLVENTFALDECNLLAWKLFGNTDTNWTDYSECGEAPLSFIQMLTRCIVKYNNINRINVIGSAAVCTSLKDLIACSINGIEAESMLVANLFAVDSCDRPALKIFQNESTMTDYNASCGELSQSFYQLLARCIVLYDGHYYLNVAAVSGSCDELHAFWTCANNSQDPETALINNIFAIDSCGHLAIKLFTNTGEAR
jgi:hypothetical protein